MALSHIYSSCNLNQESATSRLTEILEMLYPVLNPRSLCDFLKTYLCRLIQIDLFECFNLAENLSCRKFEETQYYSPNSSCCWCYENAS